jgi:saccharopine dehydrogenase-like NADP-dependent oxidoreductase
MNYALVTGASRGIGKAVAMKLAQMGYAVVIGFLKNTEAAEKVRDEIISKGGNAELLQFDISQPEQIEKALGINGINTTLSTWRSKDNTAQIDLVIERSDRIIDLCEMKFSTQQYTITEDYDKKLRERMSIFANETKTKYAVNYVFVTTFGIRNPQNHSIVSNEIILDELF